MGEKRKAPRDSENRRISLAPLDFERALGGILQAGPHTEDDTPKAEEPRPDLRRKQRFKEGPTKGQDAETPPP